MALGFLDPRCFRLVRRGASPSGTDCSSRMASVENRKANYLLKQKVVSLRNFVSPTGIEPATFGTGNRCSNPLSYGDKDTVA